MKLYSILAIAILSSSLAYSQERDIKKLSHQKKHKVAHGLITKKSYYNAVDHLNELVKEHPSNKRYVHRLADSYFLSRDYKNAEVWYEKVIKMDGKTTTIATFRYAETLKYNAKYEEAQKVFQTFTKSKYKEVKGERYKLLAENEVKSCQYAIDNRDKVNPLDIIHLGDHINSKYTEFSPTLMNDTTLVFASLQSDTVISIDPEDAHTFHVKLMQSTLSNEIWGEATNLPTVNTVYESNANGVYSTDKSKFYFTRCIPNHENHMVCKIYVSEVKDGNYSKPKKLSQTINAKGSTTTQPFITNVMVGKKATDVLFFTSNRKGTRGGLDIWYAYADKDKGFKKPVNAGRAINTIRDEVSTFYEPVSGTLYFSSNFHFGFGGYDVFKSTSKQFAQWNNPQNLGKPINTRVDDTYYNINKNTNEGFFVSNRPEGYHLTSETCCDDIYSFKLKNPFVIKTNVFVKGTKIRPDSSQLFVVARTKDALFNYNKPSLSPTDTGTVADSILTAYQKSIRSYLQDGEKTFARMEPNKIIDNSFYPELKEGMWLFDADLGKEYIVYAFDKKDTAVFTFTTDPTARTYTNTYTPDSTDVAASVSNTRKIDIIQVDLFLEKIAPPDTTTPKKVEDETTFTVAKLIEDIKKPVKKGLKVILNYDFDDANFIRDHAASLDSMVNFMKEFPELNIFITAHTDSKGSDRYNQELSKRRAKSIEDYMTTHGIEKKRMRSKGMGETEPILPNENPDGSDNEENRRINRRAEIIIEE